MIILNTTFVLDPSVSAEALAWIRLNFMDCGANETSAPMLARVRPHEPQAECETYAQHLPFSTSAEAEAWRDGHCSTLLSAMHRRWGERTLCFQTLLEVID